MLSQFGLETRTTRFELDAAPTDVYAVITQLDAEAFGLTRGPERVNAAIELDVAPANADGSIELDLPQTDLTWVDAWPATPTPGTAMLVRLTSPGSSGAYGHEVVRTSHN